MRSPVKAVTPDAMPAIQLIRNRVDVRHLGQCVMERGVEDGHARSRSPKNSSRCSNARDVVRIVQGREIDEILELTDDCVVDERRFGESLAPMHHPMTNGVDRLAILRARNALFRKPREDVFDCRGVIADRRGAPDCPFDRIEADYRFASDSIDESSRQPFVSAGCYRFLVCRNQLELER